MTKIQKVKEKVITPIVDLILGKTMSKKLTVFIIASIALFQSKLTGTEWTVIAGIYVFGLLWLNHIEIMAKFKSEENGFMKEPFDNNSNNEQH